jgi:hypothetical protein
LNTKINLEGWEGRKQRVADMALQKTEKNFGVSVYSTKIYAIHYIPATNRKEHLAQEV